MTTLRQMQARIRRYKIKPREIVVPPHVRLDLAVQIAALQPQAWLSANLAALRRDGYSGDVLINGVRLVAR